MNSCIQQIRCIRLILFLVHVYHSKADILTVSAFQIDIEVSNNDWAMAATSSDDPYYQWDPPCHQLLTAARQTTGDLQYYILGCKNKRAGNHIRFTVYIDAPIRPAQMKHHKPCFKKELDNILTEWKGFIEKQFALGSKPIQIQPMKESFKVEARRLSGNAEGEDGNYEILSEWTEEKAQNLKQILLRYLEYENQSSSVIFLEIYRGSGFGNVYVEVQIDFDITAREHIHTETAHPMLENMEKVARSFHSPLRIVDLDYLSPEIPETSEHLISECINEEEEEHVEPGEDLEAMASVSSIPKQLEPKPIHAGKPSSPSPAVQSEITVVATTVTPGSTNKATEARVFATLQLVILFAVSGVIAL